MKPITQKICLLGLPACFAALCATGCSSDKTYAGGDSAPSAGKAPAASSAPPATTPDAPSRAKPGSDDAGGR